MSKPVKSILYGFLMFVLCAAILIGVRALINGVPIAETVKSVWNWVIAGLGGISTGISTWKKETEKEESAKKNENK